MNLFVSSTWRSPLIINLWVAYVLFIPLSATKWYMCYLFWARGVPSFIFMWSPRKRSYSKVSTIRSPCEGKYFVSTPESATDLLIYDLVSPRRSLYVCEVWPRLIIFLRALSYLALQDGTNPNITALALRRTVPWAECHTSLIFFFCLYLSKGSLFFHRSRYNSNLEIRGIGRQ